MNLRWPLLFRHRVGKKPAVHHLLLPILLNLGSAVSDHGTTCDSYRSLGRTIGRLVSGNYSAGGRDPDVSAGEFGQDVERAAAVLGRGRKVGAHGG
jgi:hypothetical protein